MRGNILPVDAVILVYLLEDSRLGPTCEPTCIQGLLVLWRHSWLHLMGEASLKAWMQGSTLQHWQRFGAARPTQLVFAGAAKRLPRALAQVRCDANVEAARMEWPVSHVSPGEPSAAVSGLSARLRSGTLAISEAGFAARRRLPRHRAAQFLPGEGAYPTGERASRPACTPPRGRGSG